MKIKNALQGLAFNLVNIWDPGICKDTNEIKVIKKLRKDIAIFKPDKSSGVVLLNKNDYTTFARNLFKDNRKLILKVILNSWKWSYNNSNEDFAELTEHIT